MQVLVGIVVSPNPAISPEPARAESYGKENPKEHPDVLVVTRGMAAFPRCGMKGHPVARGASFG